MLNYEQIVHELNQCPATYVPALMRVLIKKSLRDEIFKPHGGLLRFVTLTEGQHLQGQTLDPFAHLKSEKLVRIYMGVNPEMFEITCTEKNLPEVALDVWDNPARYASFDPGEPREEFLKFVWIQFPEADRPDERIGEYVYKNKEAADGS